MPVEKDLKTAYKALYDEKEPLKALHLYDEILKGSPTNLTALIFKAACLEKLYFGFSDWHSDATMENAKELLDKALMTAEGRGDRSKIGLVNFRYFVHFFNIKDYELAQSYFKKAKNLGYVDDTLPFWEDRLETKLNKKNKKQKDSTNKYTIKPVESIENRRDNNSSHSPISPLKIETAPQESPKFKIDWYQSTTSVTISLFTVNLPESKEQVNIYISPNDRRTLSISYQVPKSGSEFQYNAKLSHEVDPKAVSLKIFPKKLEITLSKIDSTQWKKLEEDILTESSRLSDEGKNSDSATRLLSAETASKERLSYPSSSKKKIDWSKLDIDEEADEEAGSADSFFQKLYAGADPDTKRAMMKSFIESNGTALSTDWEDVSKGTVKTSPPEGMEPKHW
ncbi:AQG_2a_G0050200.mRNA.1.CDS.1 [Saccharomyces cerevisiae]|uniref:Suppressor of g2 (Two) allele of skp1 n=2 Tax=Saccharomyces cerevisiae TaxID=4932 RepID=A6ZNQ9_YEAS7|nr:Sgt1p [Saccharomyces cerevisiae YJM993]AJT71500.1 Sgt1p [Saccharomyces cerevisiae YJM193]AJT72476.1 Sgt1p [Saccharomyces cerevisiae YJM244]AJT73929.1 Sgt1p [Saccharomyces cerevisiae YJM271]AJT74911.1 Sgt1p [Saccharomyces cerevisiae YJM326]AJT76880.1 Sgt1p [Saccharomyces cerevisiae YJM453]AJT77866.1 Sgt1p [Saccharomyces cerevisiae YJM470]AJT78342.1 Sgt1p [Saccharomyces cerevisiae YJM541]AJT79332.1 Sgt1p [Saccharomyces cerevisiae YJM555]AJT80801.1 Sgt1p [Saccharomyces cerevisiae YJM682]A